MKIDQAYLTETLVKLVQIDSINPSLVPGGAGEDNIAEYTAAVLRELGLSVDILETEPGRPSVVGTRHGNGSKETGSKRAGQGRSLMLNAHYDTVGVDGMIIDPHGGEVRDGRVTLKKADGRKLNIPLSRLSQPDQDHLIVSRSIVVNVENRMALWRYTGFHHAQTVVCLATA